MTVPQLHAEVLTEPVVLEPHLPVRIGVVAPFDFALDREYWSFVPPDVDLLVTRTPVVEKPVGVEFAEDIGDPAPIRAAVRDLVTCDPEVVAYACTSASFVGGVAGEAALCRHMEEAGARRAVTTSGALVAALTACGARRVGLGTPYDAALGERLGAFLAEAGFEPVSLACLGLTADIERVGPASVFALTEAAAHDDADAVFLSCTNLRTAGLIAELERRAGQRPVLTANQVTMWAALRAAGALPADANPEFFGTVLSRVGA